MLWCSLVLWCFGGSFLIRFWWFPLSVSSGVSALSGCPGGVLGGCRKCRAVPLLLVRSIAGEMLCNVVHVDSSCLLCLSAGLSIAGCWQQLASHRRRRNLPLVLQGNHLQRKAASTSEQPRFEFRIHEPVPQTSQSLHLSN